MASQELLQVRNAFKTLQDITRDLPDVDFVISPNEVKIIWRDTEYKCTPIKAFHLIESIKQLTAHEENFYASFEFATASDEVAHQHNAL
jgi:hypothetical protein